MPSALAALVLCSFVAGCGNKHRCSVSDDCNPGRVCDRGTCVDGAGWCRGTDCRLYSISPHIAESGDLIELEGRFSPGVRVVFADGVMVTPTLAGPNHAWLHLPSSPLSGAITLVSDGAPIADEPLRQLSFAPRFAATRVRPLPVAARQAAELTRARTCLVRSGEVLFVVGGEDESGAALAGVERALVNADGSLGRFAKDPTSTLLTPRKRAACVEINHTFYVIGGVDDAGNTLATVERVTPSGTLPLFAAVPQPLMTARRDAAAVVLGDALYVVGGRDAGGHVLDSIERAQIVAQDELGDWSDAGQHLMLPRAEAIVAVASGTLVVIGGAGGSGALRSSERSVVAGDGLGTFGMGPELSEPRSGASAIRLGDWLYVFGGEGVAGPLDIIERTSLVSDKGFETVVARLTRARVGGVAAQAGNFVHLVGGDPACESLAFDDGVGFDSFSMVAPSASPRADASLVPLGRYLYSVGGHDDVNDLPDVVRAQVVNGELMEFTAAPSLKYSRSSHTTAVIGSWLYVVGGDDHSLHPDATVERAEIRGKGELGSFSVVTDVLLQRPRTAHVSAVIGDRLYVIGGRDGAGSLGAVEHATILPNGDLSDFTLDAVSLRNIRHSAAALVTGPWLYVVGGVDNGVVLNSIERFAIAGDASLGDAELVPSDLWLGTSRAQAAPLIVGAQARLVGGFGDSSSSSIVSALIAEDGTLGSFAGTTPELGNARNEVGAVVIDNWVYAVHGTKNHLVIANSERARLITP